MQRGLADLDPHERAVSDDRLAKPAKHVRLEALDVDLDCVDGDAA